jgi:hypothetical protein
MLRFEYTGNPPKIVFDGQCDDEKIAMQSKARDKFFQRVPKVPIGLPYDGQTFIDENIEMFRDRLLMLKELGYKFPNRVLAKVGDEVRESLLSPMQVDQVVSASGRRYARKGT